MLHDFRCLFYVCYETNGDKQFQNINMLSNSFWRNSFLPRNYYRKPDKTRFLFNLQAAGKRWQFSSGQKAPSYQDVSFYRNTEKFWKHQTKKLRSIPRKKVRHLSWRLTQVQCNQMPNLNDQENSSKTCFIDWPSLHWNESCQITCWSFSQTNTEIRAQCEQFYLREIQRKLSY